MGDPNTGEIYRGTPRNPGDVGLDETMADILRQKEDKARILELQQMVKERDANKPDLRTLDGALAFLDYHAPNADTLPRHNAVNAAFQKLWTEISSALPDGPGKTVTLRAVGRARMECNSCIANGGQ
jgi:hypothetical protein